MARPTDADAMSLAHYAVDLAEDAHRVLEEIRDDVRAIRNALENGITVKVDGGQEETGRPAFPPLSSDDGPDFDTTCMQMHDHDPITCAPGEDD